MSAASRLWRRAPAWRLCLVVALGTTALAAMFPPAMPGWIQAWRDRTSHAARSESEPHGATRFSPLDAVATSNKSAQGGVEMPAPGPARSGIIPFAGRQIPLPGGQWQVIALALDNAPVPIQTEMFARIERGETTGLLIIGAPNPVTGAAQPLVNPAGCFVATSIAKDFIQSAFGVTPATLECWALSASDLTNARQKGGADNIFVKGLARLQSFGAQTPGKTVGLIYNRSDQTGWMTVALILPDHRADSPAGERRLIAWVRRFTAALHEGYAHALTGKALERDPA